ncbi:hypothetical protein ACJX0J_009338, partial [Zea mays]
NVQIYKIEKINFLMNMYFFKDPSISTLPYASSHGHDDLHGPSFSQFASNSTMFQSFAIRIVLGTEGNKEVDDSHFELSELEVRMSLASAHVCERKTFNIIAKCSGKHASITK